MVGNELKSVKGNCARPYQYKMAGFIAKYMVGNQLKSFKGNCARPYQYKMTGFIAK